MKELLRQSIHFLFCISAFFLYSFKPIFLLYFSASAFFFGIFPYLYSLKYPLSKLSLFLKKVERGQRKGFSAFLLVFCFILLSIHPCQTGVAPSLLILGISDSLSAFVGSNLQSPKIAENKTLFGTFAFLISSFLILFLLGFNPLLSLAFTLLELLPFEDNLTLSIFGPFLFCF